MRKLLILAAIAFLFVAIAAPTVAFAQDATATTETTEEPTAEPEESGDEGSEDSEEDMEDEDAADDEAAEEEAEGEEAETTAVETLPATGGADALVLALVALGGLFVLAGGSRVARQRG